MANTKLKNYPGWYLRAQRIVARRCKASAVVAEALHAQNSTHFINYKPQATSVKPQAKLGPRSVKLSFKRQAASEARCNLRLYSILTKRQAEC